MKKKILCLFLSVSMLLSVVSCANTPNRQRRLEQVGRTVGTVGNRLLNRTVIGAIAGAILGGITGGIIGHDSHESVAGAGIGILGGGFLGALLGSLGGGPASRVATSPPEEKEEEILSEDQLKQLQTLLEEILERKLEEKLGPIRLKLDEIERLIRALPEEQRTILRQELEAARKGELPIEEMMPPTAGAEEAAPPLVGESRERREPALRMIHFDFDKYSIRSTDEDILRKNAEWMKNHPKENILVEGHADDRGTNEYNLALGDRRAMAVKSFLVSLGVEEGRLFTVSYGEERPIDARRNEKAWSLNRRAEFKILEQGRKLPPERFPPIRKR